jgi:hypothetical protein
LPPRGLLAIFLLENLPVMVANSVVHCSYKKGDKLRLCYNNKFATRTLSLICKDFMMISSCCS